MSIDAMGTAALSEAVAREIMGWDERDGRWSRPGEGAAPERVEVDPPAFATDAEAARSVIERGFRAEGRWSVSHAPTRGVYTLTLHDDEGGTVVGQGETLPIATCRAVLKLRRAGTG